MAIKKPLSERKAAFLIIKYGSISLFPVWVTNNNHDYSNNNDSNNIDRFFHNTLK
jgi:hypothetical protein